MAKNFKAALISLTYAETFNHKDTEELYLNTIEPVINDNLEEMSKDRTYDGVRAIEDHGLTLVSIHGIMDIVRETVPLAVDKCKKAGIKVRMVTGDNKITAEAVAK